MAPNQDSLDSIQSLRASFTSDSNLSARISELARSSLARANSNASKNTYLWRDEAWTLDEAQRSSSLPREAPAGNQDGWPPLRGIPVSVKDCFDLVGAPTSCGTIFYRERNGNAQQDSWLVERLRAAGAVITGKTHLHPLAYGITGENPDFGDCLQPGNAGALTGGSSSGAAASVMEGSAMAAIGTDTGGSVRVPAALCGLAAYRASLGRGDWRGGAHLAESFDTFGWLFRDLEDGPLLGSIFGPTDATGLKLPRTFAIVHEDFLHDCEPEVKANLRKCQAELESLGLIATTVPVEWWSDSTDIYAPIQASESARIHRGHFEHFESSIRRRLQWGETLTEPDLARFRQRHAAFRAYMDTLLAKHELLLLPAAPIVRLTAGADHSQTRPRLLRYTTPASLSGMPAVTIPFHQHGRPSGGMQLIAAREDDPRLLATAAALGVLRKPIDPTRHSY
ncbi:amidase [Acidicapsa acidisoli]|uniref:amidase n=1 Tax=Acidicapsa acidisoli TaxID=1615681 RepID=UPI0021E061B1|nr:amidase [Acidicapsa acidisoli]